MKKLAPQPYIICSVAEWSSLPTLIVASLLDKLKTSLDHTTPSLSLSTVLPLPQTLAACQLKCSDVPLISHARLGLISRNVPERRPDHCRART